MGLSPRRVRLYLLPPRRRKKKMAGPLRKEKIASPLSNLENLRLTWLERLCYSTTHLLQSRATLLIFDLCLSPIVCRSKVVPWFVPRNLVTLSRRCLKTHFVPISIRVSASAPLSRENTGGINLCEASTFFLRLSL